MPAKTKAVVIKRGKYSSYFQVARAHLSAASAVIGMNRTRATKYINDAIAELNRIKDLLTKEGA